MASNELVTRSANDLVLRPNYPTSRQQRRETIPLRGCQIIFRNFEGKPTQFNPEGGDRGFSILLDEALAMELQERGMNVKPLKNYDDDTDRMYHLPVAVSYRIRPPRIYMVTGDGDLMPLRKTLLPEDMLQMMDNLEFSEVNMVIAVSNYEVRGTKGKKAYLQSLFGHVLLDELEQEYATVEDMMHFDSEKHQHLDTIEGEIVE